MYGHRVCQRAILRGEVTQNVRNATAARDAWHAELRAVAEAHGHTSISTMDALVNLVKRGALRVEDLTHDGMHPIYWPWRDPGGFVYTSYVEAMLRAAIVGRHGAYAPPVVGPDRAPPPSNASVGLRCYGAQDEWKGAVRNASGFRHGRHDFVYADGAWQKDRRRTARPGYTSLVAGDRLELEIDARGARAADVQYFQSYEHTGVFEVRCLRGCACAASVDALTPAIRLATTRVARFDLRDGEAECRVAIINRSTRPTPDTKVKISAVSVIG